MTLGERIHALRRDFRLRVGPRRTLLGRTRFQPGTIEVHGWNIEYVDAHALWSCIDVIVRRGWNDFVADREDPRILDCGANVGIATLHYRTMYPRARITAFEPDPQFAPVLRRNLLRNGAGDVEVVEAAVWTGEGEMDFLCEGADGSRLVTDVARPGTKRVRTIDFDAYLGEPIDLVKMDIEGAEYEVLAHSRDRLHVVKNLVVECHLNSPAAGRLAHLLGALAESGFSVTVNSYGQWRDLVRRPAKLPMEFDQYLLVAAWREST